MGAHRLPSGAVGHEGGEALTAGALPVALLEAARAVAERIGARGAALAFLEARARAHDGGRAVVFGVDDPGLGARPAGAAGRLYEALLGGGARRGLGAFYTPDALADRLVGAALAGADDADVADGALPFVVDPACGAGAFLLAAARRLEARARGAGHPQPRAAAAACLSGVDKDPGAIEICRAVLAAEGYEVPADRLAAADALAAPWPVERAGAVVGNPPFVNIVRLPGAERAALKARYRTFRNKCDLYGLFVEAAADHLAPGGRLALILSDSFLGAASFAPLRRLLFDDDAIACRSIDRIEGPAFAAAVHPMAVVAERRRALRTPGAPDGTIRFGTLDATGRPGAQVHIDAGRLARRAHRSVAIPADPEDLVVAEAMADGAVPLGELATLSLGVKTGDDGRFLSQARASASFVPCVRGRSLARYRARRDGFLDYRPEVLRTVHGARPRRIESFDRPLKILLRETSGARLVAAMDTARLVPLDTVHAIFPHEGDAPPACSLWYLLAILCAAPTSYWYGQHHPGAHVKAAEVRALPVPPPHPPSASSASLPSPADLAAAVAGAVLFLARGDPAAAPPTSCLAAPVRHVLLDLLARELSREGPDDAHRAAAVALVDAIVAHAYGVTAAEPPVDRAGARRYRLLR